MPLALKGAEAREAAPLEAARDARSKAGLGGECGSGWAGSRGAGGPRGARESSGARAVPPGLAPWRPAPAAVAGWPGVIHSQPGDSWPGPQFLPETQRPLPSLMQTGETKDSVAELGLLTGRYGLTASPTFLPASQGTLRDPFPGIRTEHGPRWSGGGEDSASGAESSGRQWGKRPNAWELEI